MRGTTARFLQDDRGATAIEYGLICGLIFLAIVAALSATGGGVAAMWNGVMEKAAAALAR